MSTTPRGPQGAAPEPSPGSGEARLEREAALFARYLLADQARDLTGGQAGDRHGDLPPELVRRYVDAHRHLPLAPRTPEDLAVLALVHRRPWTLPRLDAALGLLSPRSALRAKLVTLTAILEASPHHADFFLAPPPGRARLVIELAATGLAAAFDALLGLLLVAWLRLDSRR